MKYFLDTEFIEDGRTIELISIGIVSEGAREYYAISSEFDESKANDWVKENVLRKLEPGIVRTTKRTMAKQIVDFITANGQFKEGFEFYGYFADYDWVVFCQLFGTMMDLPEGFPMYCRDIKQLCDDLGNPKLPIQHFEHNALSDAKWNREAYEFLINKEFMPKLGI